ncbi:hypothetical protein AT6N2_C0909 [Agrobacterium tumefaciens]|nr:hypothetical protein AT6N2_C0909 [Agrobacterium tumefaciens]
MSINRSPSWGGKNALYSISRKLQNVQTCSSGLPISESVGHAKPETLFLVVVFLGERNGVIDADRTERRCPHHTDTGRCADGVVVLDGLRCGDLVAIHRAGIDEAGKTQAEVFRNARHWRRHFSRSRKIGRAADGVITDTRTDTIVLEAANLTTAELELIEDQKIVIRRHDMTSLTGQRSDDVILVGQRVVVPRLGIDLVVFGVATETRKFVRQRSLPAFARHVAVIERVVVQGVRNDRLGPVTTADQSLIRFCEIGVVLPVALTVIIDLLVGVFECRRQIFRDRSGDAQCKALFVVVIEVFALALVLEEVEAGSQTVAEEIGLREGQRVRTRIVFTSTSGDTDILTATEEVLFFDRCFEQHAIVLRVARTDTERTRRLIFNVNHDHDAVRRAAAGGRDIDLREVTQRFETTLCSGNDRLVERIAFGNIEFATDDIVTRAGVTADFDTLDVSALALIDDIGHANGVARHVAVAARRNTSERITFTGNALGNRFHALLNFLGAVASTLTGFNKTLKLGTIDARNGRFDRDVAEVVLLAFVNGDGDGVFVLCLVQDRLGRDDAEVGITVVVVELAQRLFIGAQLVLIVDVLTRQERQHVGLLGIDDGGETTIAVGIVANKIDAADLRTLTFVDDESNVYTALTDRHGLRGDFDIATTDGSIGVLDAGDVSRHDGLIERAHRLGLHDAGELVVLDLAVAVEHHLVDKLVLVDRHDQRAAGNAHGDIREVTGGVKTLHRLIDVRIGKVLAWRNGDVGTNRIRTRPFGPANVNSADDGCLCNASRGKHTKARNRRNTGRQSNRRHSVQKS